MTRFPITVPPSINRITPVLSINRSGSNANPTNVRAYHPPTRNNRSRDPPFLPPSTRLQNNSFSRGSRARGGGKSSPLPSPPPLPSPLCKLKFRARVAISRGYHDANHGENNSRSTPRFIRTASRISRREFHGNRGEGVGGGGGRKEEGGEGDSFLGELGRISRQARV